MVLPIIDDNDKVFESHHQMAVSEKYGDKNVNFKNELHHKKNSPHIRMSVHFIK